MPLRDIIVTDGCLGMLPGRTLEIGDIQHMAFQVDDDPPLKFAKGFPPATTYIGMPGKFDRPMTPFERTEFDKKLEAAKKAKAKKIVAKEKKKVSVEALSKVADKLWSEVIRKK